jgi:hypothetical protein
MKFLIRAAAVAAACLTVACSSGNPACPSSGCGGSPSIVAPTPASPSNGTTVANASQPVTLVAQNATTTQAGTVTYTFEVATDSAFASKVQTKDGVAQGASGQTSATLATLLPNTVYYWHVRANEGSTTGTFSPTYTFTVGPPITLSTPIPVTPVNGAPTTNRPTLTVQNSTRQGVTGAIAMAYKFEVSIGSDFSSLVFLQTVPEGVAQTSVTPSSNLPTGTLYWRATAIDTTDNVSSATSAAQSFSAGTASPQEILAAAIGQTLWPGNKPSGTNGHATMGDTWDVQTLYYGPGNVYFQGPRIEWLRLFDLLDKGFDPDGAISWMNGNGYPTAAAWYPPPDKAVIGLEYVYIAARNKIVVNGTWDVIVKAE